MFETPNERKAEAVRLRDAGWSRRRIAARLGRSKSTVDRYLMSADTGRSISKVAEGRPRGGPGDEWPRGGPLTEDWHRRRRDAAPATQVFDALHHIAEASKVLQAHWHGPASIEGLRRAHLTPNVDRLDRAIVVLMEVVDALDRAGFRSEPPARKVTQDRVIDWEGGNELTLNRHVHRRDQSEREEFEEKQKAERTRAQEVARLTRVVQDDLPGAREAAQRLHDEFGKSGDWLRGADDLPP